MQLQGLGLDFDDKGCLDQDLDPDFGTFDLDLNGKGFLDVEQLEEEFVLEQS